MALTDTNGGNELIMPVQPLGSYGYGGGGFGGFGGDWGSLIVLFLIAAMFGGFGGGWGMGMGGFGGGLGIDFPWLMNGQQGINSNVSDGFRDQMLSATVNGIQNAVTSGFGDVQLGIAGVNQNICQTGNGIVSAVTGAQNALTQQMYADTIASLERDFNSQTAITGGISNVSSQLAQCCCDNRLATCQTQNVIQSEAAQNRYADANNTRDIIQSQTAGTQAILDKLCQLELDGVKAQVEAKNDRILDLQNQLNLATMRESQTAQNAFISQGLANEVDQLYNRLNNCPVPTTPVYGRTPIFTCNNGGCGCSGNATF